MKTKQHILFAALVIGCIGATVGTSPSFSDAEITNSRTTTKLKAVETTEYGDIDDLDLRSNIKEVSVKNKVIKNAENKKVKAKEFTFTAEFYTLDPSVDKTFYVGYSDDAKKEVNYKPAQLVFNVAHTHYVRKEKIVKDDKGNKKVEYYHVIRDENPVTVTEAIAPIVVESGKPVYQTLNSKDGNSYITCKFRTLIEDTYNPRDDKGVLMPTAEKIDLQKDGNGLFIMQNIFTEVKDGEEPVGTTFVAKNGKTLETNKLNANRVAIQANINKIASSHDLAGIRVSVMALENGISLRAPYYIGWGTSKEDTIFGKLVYFVKKGDEIIKKSVDLERKNVNTPYDLVGSSGSNYLSILGKVPLTNDETLLTDTFYVENIFRPLLPNENKDDFKDVRETVIKGKTFYYVPAPLKVNNDLSELREAKLHELIDIEYKGLTTFNGTGAATFSIKNLVDLDKYYSVLQPFTQSLLKGDKEKFESGEFVLQVKMKFDAKTTFTVETTDGKVISFKGKSGYVTVDDAHNQFIIYHPSLNVSNIKSIKADSFNIHLNTLNTKTGTNKANLCDNFTYYDTYLYRANDQKVFYFDASATMGIIMGVFIAIYVGVSIFVYFYWKKKYQDDIFKRVRTKPYWTNNIMGLVASGSLLLAIVAISLRVTALNNSLPVYNSIDIIIVFFSITAIIFCGYFIKYFAVQIKNNREKKRNEKMNLNKNSIDDGTLILSTSDKEGE